jgi:hypothetical protein
MGATDRRWGLSQWFTAGVFVLLGGMGVTLYFGVFRNPSGTPHDSGSGKSKAPEGLYEKAGETRQKLIRDLLLALGAAAEKGDKGKIALIQNDLVREGDATVDPARGALRDAPAWNLKVALISVLGRIRTPSSLGALEEYYASLKPNDAAAKLEVVRVVSQMGGSLSREALRKLLAGEADPKVRPEIAKTLASTGMRPEELELLAPKDRELLEKDVRARDARKERIEALEKLDPKAESSLPILKKAATEESVIAIAVLAFRKLEARDDAAAAAALLERARAKAETEEGKIIQTNAITSLARMKAGDARLACREIVLGPDAGLRKQGISLLGSFGDETMIPVLEQAAKVDATPEVRKLVDQSTALIRSRAGRSSQPGSP